MKLAQSSEDTAKRVNTHTTHWNRYLQTERIHWQQNLTLRDEMIKIFFFLFFLQTSDSEELHKRTFTFSEVPDKASRNFLLFMQGSILRYPERYL